MTNVEITEKLKEPSDGLLYMSESDYPFEVFYWESKELLPLTGEKLLQQTSHPQDTPVEVVGVDDFFEVATTEQDWHGEEEKQTVKRFQTLVEMLKTNLTNLQVYRLGSIEIDVYIIGQTPEGHLAGLSTKAIET